MTSSHNFQDSHSTNSDHESAAPNDERDARIPEGFTGPTGPAAYRHNQAEATETELESAQESQNSAEQAGTTAPDQVAQLEQTLAQTRDQLLRTVAELDNMRKRSQREREDASKYAVSGFARDLLDVADTFKRALHAIPKEVKSDERNKAVIEGLEAMERALLRCFEKNGIKRIEPMDELFDPHYHEVMFEAPFPDKAQGTIIQLIEPGYILHDRLLRPARVGVAKSVSSDQAPYSLDTQA